MKAAGKCLVCCLVLVALISTGCSTYPKTAESRDVLSAQVDEAITVMKARDPGIDRFFEQSYGYAVLPKIFKGAFIVGGAGGRGAVFEKANLVGYCTISQASLGFSFGGEFFREIIFFRDKADLDKFKAEEITFSAQATGVALTSGAAAKTDYKAGMAVFITADKGLMIDASLGGQKFNYAPAMAVAAK